MTIPRYDELQYPLLKHLASGSVVKKADLEPVMAAFFALSDDERSQEYESQKGHVFYDRISWALSYLCLSGLLARPKRAHYQITDQRDEIQNFVGALAVAQSKKGVFIATSSFSKGAQEYATSLNGSTNLVLINGQQLARYVYDFGLGMQDEQTIVIRKLDGDFWDQFPDDPAAAEEQGG